MPFTIQLQFKCILLFGTRKMASIVTVWCTLMKMNHLGRPIRFSARMLDTKMFKHKAG
jgi:hypothetical protein